MEITVEEARNEMFETVVETPDEGARMWESFRGMVAQPTGGTALEPTAGMQPGAGAKESTRMQGVKDSDLLGAGT